MSKITLQEAIKWFTDLKNEGIKKNEILDCLEFDSDQHPNMQILEEARDIVFGREGGGK